MKSNAIIRIIIWSIVLILLTGIFAGFIVEERYMRDYTPAETAIPVPLETEVVATPAQILPNEETLTFPADSIREMEIEWVAGDIIFLVSDADTIRLSESDVADSKYSMIFQTRGEKLEIDFCEESLISGFSIGSNVPSKDLYVHVPKDWVCDSLEIDAASANLELHDLTIREMDFDGASGTGDFQNCRITDLDIDTASGDVYYTGTLDTLDFDAASASFIADFQNTPSRIDMDSMDGKLDIALPEDCGYTLTMDGISSRFRSDFQGTAMKNNSLFGGDGRCRINVDGMSCDVTIRNLTTITIDPTEDTIVPCSKPGCSDPACTEHGHTAEECTDKNCKLHHTEENCTDANCAIHSHTGSTHSDHDSKHGSDHH